MYRTIFLVTILILGISSGTATQFCPVPQSGGSLFIGSVTASTQNGLVNLVQGTDVQEYNYQLQGQYSNRPGIAVAITSFASQPSPDLFFSIKPIVSSTNYNSVTFIIKTTWCKTNWSQIKFNFFVEDRLDIEAGYYLVDSGSLSTSIEGKNVNVLLPFKTQFNSQVVSKVFLHGLQISSTAVPGYQGVKSPLQVQIAASSSSSNGVTVTLSVTTSTRVFCLYISYIAYNQASSGIFGGEQERYNPGNSFSVSVQSYGSSYLSFFGLSGFVLSPSSQTASFDIALVNTNFNVALQPAQYSFFEFSYILFTGSPCSSCPGYPIWYNNQCYAQCPVGTYFNAQIGGCIVCQNGQFWNGNACVSCTGGQIWNGNACVCPQGLNWNGNACISCIGGQIWNGNACVCPQGLNWNGNACISCIGGQIWNGNTCVCPQGLNWNGNTCSPPIQTCTGGRIWNNGQCICISGSWNGFSCITCPAGQNLINGQCSCPQGTTWNGFACAPSIQTCTGGQYWQPQWNKCICPNLTVWNGFTCAPSIQNCIGGQYWQPQWNQCICPNGTSWNGFTCSPSIQTCLNGQIWDAPNNCCKCPSGTVWNGYACAPSITTCPSNQIYNGTQCVCPAGTFWNGNICAPSVVTCPGNQIYNPLTQRCECPNGSFLQGFSCIACPAPRIWDPVRRCICPSGQQWTGSSCVLIKCPGNQYWSTQYNECVCQNGFLWNGNLCINQTCPPGQVYDSSIGQCKCQNGLYFFNNRCQKCPQGRLWDDVSKKCECPRNTYWSGFACLTCSGERYWCPTTNQCKCPESSSWNGNSCEITCQNGQIPINGKCFCPKQTYWTGFKCIACPAGKMWNGLSCVDIQCPPGSFWDGTRCNSGNKCPQNYYFDGTNCVPIKIQCPPGTIWQNGNCQPSGNNCQNGFYFINGQCIPISGQCPPSTIWNGFTCVPQITGQCPNGTTYSGNTCVPNIGSCSNGQIWSSTHLKCICIDGYIWNGKTCASCGGGQQYIDGKCCCPFGSFWTGSSCEQANNDKCGSIDNSAWNGTHCVCNPGFSVVGYHCVCNGLDLGDRCDRCYHKPNSQFQNGICKCKSGFFEINGQCVKTLPPNPNPSSPANCSIATFFEPQEKRCVPCPDGCLACQKTFECTSCRSGFDYDVSTKLCKQICGDGKRFVLACDDGDNTAGDGCAPDCTIETGYTCYGGSPSSPDTCTSAVPPAIIIKPTGQTHLWGIIVMNVQLNYLPKSLLESAACNSFNNCKKVLLIDITNGFKQFTSIVAKYIPGSSFTFSIEIHFGIEPLGEFKARVRINPEFANHFTGIDITSAVNVEVFPALLSRVMHDSDEADDILK